MSEQIFQVTDEDIEKLLHEILENYGYDFINYSRASLKRRIHRLVLLDKFPSMAEFRFRVLYDKAYLERFIEQITVNVTEMFRDTSFNLLLRNQILPVLATKPLIRIWHAGCSTGEEVYSMAIMLKEANLLHKSLLYATDINPAVLETVRRGVFPLGQMKLYSENYVHSGGREDFSSYYTAQYDSAKFDEALGERIILSTHNLVSDHSFNEFQLILCRNVMIYFDKKLQDRVVNLFNGSLEMLGFLALGSKETLKYSPVAGNFRQFDGKEKVWQKIA